MKAASAHEHDASFQRYLEAKRSIDDRSLNHGVWQSLCESVGRQIRQPTERPFVVAEIGAGIGTMVERVVDWGLFAESERPIHYMLIDELAANIEHAQSRLAPSALMPPLQFEAMELFDWIDRTPVHTCDLLIAHAFLDLMDIPSTLARLRPLLAPGGLVYLSITFDGVTAFEPAIAPDLDDTIEQLYHETMDKRMRAGKPSGDSRAGRHLFHALRSNGYTICSAGSSDWVVFADSHGNYAADEAYFLHFIINTVFAALREHPQLDAVRFAAWIDERHRQIDCGELVYIAHQLDFLAAADDGAQSARSPFQREHEA